MSSISQWLRMEEKDFTEPAGFYVPGTDHWWSAAKPVAKDYTEWEVQALVDLWSLDEQ